LAPRRSNLRPFVLMSAFDDIQVVPGGMTRMALDAGALVVNAGAQDAGVVG